jgi:hypothetical protein
MCARHLWGLVRPREPQGRASFPGGPGAGPSAAAGGEWPGCAADGVGAGGPRRFLAGFPFFPPFFFLFEDKQRHSAAATRPGQPGSFNFGLEPK